LAADLKAGRLELKKLTNKQLAALCGVSVPYVREANRIGADSGKRTAALEGSAPLYKNGKAERLVAHIKQATPAELREIAQLLGVDFTWDHLVAPFVA
jgi:hypothetical protein